MPCFKKLNNNNVQNVSVTYTYHTVNAHVWNEAKPTTQFLCVFNYANELLLHLSRRAQNLLLQKQPIKQLHAFKPLFVSTPETCFSECTERHQPFLRQPSNTHNLMSEVKEKKLLHVRAH